MNFLHEMGENFKDINKYALFSRIAELKNLLWLRNCWAIPNPLPAMLFPH